MKLLVRFYTCFSEICMVKNAQGNRYLDSSFMFHHTFLYLTWLPFLSKVFMLHVKTNDLLAPPFPYSNPLTSKTINFKFWTLPVFLFIKINVKKILVYEIYKTKLIVLWEKIDLNGQEDLTSIFFDLFIEACEVPSIWILQNVEFSRRSNQFQLSSLIVHIIMENS